ncbi:fasciclin domain-containing protein [Leptolyngbya sp. FACHB-321]|uniref:fasciclin domain-containing protein n=1 Tax=Leptolyngbya sp. FACHB-321 TaxID=2692807 RepID=UPI001684F1A5|nr:fasciclin domain-containing protein [Leptolyngbya sp. FACHB-321]
MNYSLKLLVGFLAAAGVTTGINLVANAQQTPGTMTAPAGAGQVDSPIQPSPAQAAPGDQAPTQQAPMEPVPTQSAPVQPSSTPLQSPNQSSVSVPESSASLSIDTIVEKSDSFNILNSLLRVADRNGELSRQLAGGGTYTVFAPTDRAFAALPEGTIKRLVQPENRATLIKILSYHVVPGKVDSSKIESGETRSVQGSPLNIQANAGSVTINDAQVIQADIEARNGVIHAVNKVILPPDVQASMGVAPQASGSVNPLN